MSSHSSPNPSLPRVLHVISNIDPRGGGPATALVGLCRAQRKVLDQPVSVVTTYRDQADLSHVRTLADLGVTVHALGPARGPLARHAQLVPTVAKALETSDILHIHAVWEEVQHQAAKLASRAGVPYLIRPCGMLDPWCLNQSKWKKKLYLAWRLRHNLNRASAIHFTTEIERDLVAPLKLKPPAIVEPNGVDLQEFESLPQRGTFRAHHPEIGERPMLLFLSRIHHKKGLDLLIPAFAAMNEREMVLVIAGPDSPDGYQKSVERMARDAGVADRVVFTGMLYGAERIEAMVDADLFVLPSYQENFGIVVVEALAAGTPVVISDQVNLHTEITGAGLGAVVPTEVAPLAAALEAWMNDPDRRRDAGNRAQRYVRERFDWREIARRWAERYQQILTGSRRNDSSRRTSGPDVA